MSPLTKCKFAGVAIARIDILWISIRLLTQSFTSTYTNCNYRPIMKNARNLVFILAFAISILPTITYAWEQDCGGGKIHSISEGYYGYADFSFTLEPSSDLPPPPEPLAHLAITEYGRTQNLLDGRRAIIGAYFGNKFVRLFNPYQPDCRTFAQIDVVVCNREADCKTLTH